MLKIFVYGTLRAGASNHDYLQSSKCLFKQAWTYGELFDTNQGYPVMKRTNKHKVIGEVYEISESDLTLIDALEGYEVNGKNNLYDRIIIDVYNDKGEVIKAITYVSGHSFSGAVDKIAFGDWRLYNYLQKDKLLYFAYGSCMDDERFKIANVNKFFLDMKGVGILEEHALRFTHRTADGGKADIVEANQEHVEGKVYQVPRAAINYLYQREGVYTNSYRPAVVILTIDGKQTEALTFIVVEKKAETCPSTLYETEIIRGGTSYLSETYLADIVLHIKKICSER